VDELVAPLRRVKLDDPVDVWDIDSSGCQICGEQD